MPEKTKQTEDCAKSAAEKPENDSGNWSEDQKKKTYYYDDDYGYEVYKPDEDDEDEAENAD